MYYYIMEQPKGLGVARILPKIKDTLSLLGIAGEIATVSPARTAEELVQIAISKGYSTIVAVGSDRLVGKISPFLLEKEAALGFIPTTSDSQIAKIVGVQDFRQACQILKRRRLKTLSICLIEPNKFFLTEALINISHASEVDLEFDGSRVQTRFTDITISNLVANTNLGKNFYHSPDKSAKLVLEIRNREKNKLLSKMWKWLLGQKQEDIFVSIFRANKAILRTAQPLPVTVFGEISAKTPLVVKIVPLALKIITERVNISLSHDKLKNKGELN